MGEYLEQQPSRDEIDALAGPAVVAFGTNWCGYCLGAKRHIKPALADHLSSAKLVRNPDTVDGVQGGREVVG